MRLKDKIAIVVGAGQSPCEGMGNGRATVLRFWREGAWVMAADRDLASAEETVAMARQHGPCVAFEADVTKEKMLAAMVAAAREKFGRIKVTHGECICCNPSSSESWLLTMNTHWTPMMPVVIGVAAATLC